jgi:hypothetical protein
MMVMLACDGVTSTLLTTIPGTELSDLDWHTISTVEALTRLSSNIDHGLSSDQVERKKKEHGKNMPSKPPSNTLSKYFYFYAKVLDRIYTQT